MSRKAISGLCVILVGLALWFMPVPAGLKAQSWHLFAIFVATILGFILQPLPIGSVAFISITLTGLLKVLKPEEVLSGFSDTTIWLIFSAFVFTKGFTRTGLGRRISYLLIRFAGTSTLRLVYALALAETIIAPATPSNTARCGGVIFPIARSLCSAFDSEPGPTAKRFGSYFMQAVYHNSMTSGLFITAMASNVLVVALAAKTINVNISWSLWALAASVPGLIGLAVNPYFLYKIYPPEIKETPSAKQFAQNELDKMGPMSKAEKTVAIVFLGALLLWATSDFTNVNATIVGMMVVSALLITKIIDWEDVMKEKGAWDTVVWMGAIVSLAGQLNKLGFISWFAKGAAESMKGVPWEAAFIAFLLIYTYSHYGFASLTAHIAAMYAPFCAVAVAAGAPPYLVALALAYASSICKALTHYAAGATPIFFGAGYVDQATWWRLGFYVSVMDLVVWVGLGSVWWKILGLW